MYEYWNDPPDDDYEIPSTCPHCGSHDTVIVTLNNQFACENCNAIIECESRDDVEPYDTVEEKELGYCRPEPPEEPYDYAADDLAFDAERERRMR